MEQINTQHTDVSNAERFVQDWFLDLKYCSTNSKWLTWNGSRWIWDECEVVVERAQETATKMLEEAQAIQDNDKRAAVMKHAVQSQSRVRIESMIRLARPGLAIKLEDLDSDLRLIGLRNGTFDLEILKLEPPWPDPPITMQAQVDYDPEARCPQWRTFLGEITGGIQPLVDYLQRAIGYSITGDTKEHALFILFGSGCNGKSTFIETIRYVFGDYAKAADFSTFTGFRSNGGARNDLARLARARLVTAAEAENECELAEAFVKQVTGGDTVTARFLYKEHFEFTPTFKLWLCTNHRPHIRGIDEGIWRRIRLIPFSVRIPNENIDRNLAEKLKAEAPGIFNWVIEGLRQYRIQGLNEPAIVRNATSGYRFDEDVVGRFIASCCSVGPTQRVQARKLYQAFREWTAAFGEPLLDERKFSQAMAARGISGAKTKAGKFWLGIELAKNQEVAGSIC